MKFFFRQIGPCCGVCAVNTILKMFNKSGVIFSISPIRGTSPKRIMQELRKAGLNAISKKISIYNVKPRSILYYEPPNDHYVVVGDVKNGKILIYDSAKHTPYWTTPSSISKNWKGWVIEVKKINGKD